MLRKGLETRRNIRNSLDLGQKKAKEVGIFPHADVTKKVNDVPALTFRGHDLYGVPALP